MQTPHVWSFYPIQDRTQSPVLQKLNSTSGFAAALIGKPKMDFKSMRKSKTRFPGHGTKLLRLFGVREMDQATLSDSRVTMNLRSDKCSVRLRFCGLSSCDTMSILVKGCI